MELRYRAYCSILALSVVCIVTKLWATSITDNDSPVLKMMQMAETSLQKAEKSKSTTHIAYAIGLCEAARLVMSDPNIEKITGIHIQTFSERLNSLLCQYSRFRRDKKKRERD